MQLNPQQVSRKRFELIRDMIFDLVFACVCFGLPTSNKDDGVQKCNTPIVNWLYVYGGVRFLASIMGLFKVIAISKQALKCIAVIDAFGLCVILNFQVAWLIYGNTFHYSTEGLICKDLNQNANSCWTLMMVILAFGYLYFLLYALILCCCCCVLCMVGASGGLSSLNNNPMVDRIPYMNAVKGLNKKNYKDVQEKNKSMDECVICMEQYKDDDEIAELKCSEKHYFHSKCLEEWLKSKLECPLCKRVVSSND
jgi:hypothetical protein